MSITLQKLAEAVRNEASKQNATIYQSSTLAVAKETLGELTHDELEYSRGRGGALFVGMDDTGEPVVLSWRVVFDLMRAAGL